ncbi:MAG TPA: glycosyltransferase family 4 protein [Flavobacteriales bacterium]|jgi:glycosyltransferase involved in cell wall biosynthesis|nr:glycosyltransferase family 4 protein [Flavobacteriales bacterium]
MRILQLCHKPPYPPIDGGTKAMHSITMGLLEAGHTVKVLCISTPKHPMDPDSMPADYRERTGIEGVFADTSLNVVDAFTDLVTADNYNISRFFSPDMDIRLIQLLSREEFSIVQLESLFMTPYIPTIRRYSRARIVLRSHNLEHVVQERLAKGEKHLLKKPYRRFLAKQLKDYEHEVLGRVDGVAAITPSDAEHFHAHNSGTPVATIPFGVDPSDYDVPAPTGPLVFFHLGSMDWLPNEEGVRWLLQHVWPKVVKKHPQARLHLAGNKMPKDLLAADLPGVTVSGRVPDADAYLAKRHVMVVPLFSAGGMRVKIIEGMAMGKCVISTPMGAEGITCTDGTDILLARTATEFVDRIGEVLADPAVATRIGKNARALVRQRYASKRIVQELIAFYRTLRKA